MHNGSYKNVFLVQVLSSYYCKRSELSNPGSILMMYVRMYVSVTLRNVAVTFTQECREHDADTYS